MPERAWLNRLPPARDVWVPIRPDLTKVPRVRVVVEYLLDLFRRERKLLAGD